MNAIVYTAIFGGYDPLKPQPVSDGPFLAFLNEPTSAPPPWRIVPTKRSEPSPRLDARRHKLLPHVVLPACDYSLWLDGSIQLKPGVSVAGLVDEFLGDADVACFAHPTRRCIYEEAWDGMCHGLDERTRIFDQISRYTREGFPSNAGLYSTGFLLRRHSPAIHAMDDAWWQELSSGCLRDQVSFPYVLRKHGIKIRVIPGTIYENPYLSIARHTISRLRPRRPTKLQVERFLNRVVSSLHQRAPETYEAAHLLSDRIAPHFTSWLRRLESEDL